MTSETYHCKQASRETQLAERVASASEETPAAEGNGRHFSVGQNEHLAADKHERGRYFDPTSHAALHTNTHTSASPSKRKAEHLYSALHGTNHLTALRHGSHRF